MATRYVITTADDDILHNTICVDFDEALTVVASYYGWHTTTTSESFRVYSPCDTHERDAWSVYPPCSKSRPAGKYGVTRIVRFEDSIAKGA